MTASSRSLTAGSSISCPSAGSGSCMAECKLVSPSLVAPALVVPSAPAADDDEEGAAPARPGGGN